MDKLGSGLSALDINGQYVSHISHSIPGGGSSNGDGASAPVRVVPDPYDVVLAVLRDPASGHVAPSGSPFPTRNVGPLPPIPDDKVAAFYDWLETDIHFSRDFDGVGECHIKVSLAEILNYLEHLPALASGARFDCSVLVGSALIWWLGEEYIVQALKAYGLDAEQIEAVMTPEFRARLRKPPNDFDFRIWIPNATGEDLKQAYSLLENFLINKLPKKISELDTSQPRIQSCLKELTKSDAPVISKWYANRTFLSRLCFDGKPIVDGRKEDNLLLRVGLRASAPFVSQAHGSDDVAPCVPIELVFVSKLALPRLRCDQLSLPLCSVRPPSGAMVPLGSYTLGWHYIFNLLCRNHQMENLGEAPHDHEALLRRLVAIVLGERSLTNQDALLLDRFVKSCLGDGFDLEWVVKELRRITRKHAGGNSDRTIAMALELCQIVQGTDYEPLFAELFRLKATKAIVPTIEVEGKKRKRIRIDCSKIGHPLLQCIVMALQKEAPTDVLALLQLGMMTRLCLGASLESQHGIGMEVTEHAPWGDSLRATLSTKSGPVCLLLPTKLDDALRQLLLMIERGDGLDWEAVGALSRLLMPAEGVARKLDGQMAEWIGSRISDKRLLHDAGLRLLEVPNPHATLLGMQLLWMHWALDASQSLPVTILTHLPFALDSFGKPEGAIKAIRFWGHLIAESEHRNLLDSGTGALQGLINTYECAKSKPQPINAWMGCLHKSGDPKLVAALREVYEIACGRGVRTESNGLLIGRSVLSMLAEVDPFLAVQQLGVLHARGDNKLWLETLKLVQQVGVLPDSPQKMSAVSTLVKIVKQSHRSGGSICVSGADLDAMLRLIAALTDVNSVSDALEIFSMLLKGSLEGKGAASKLATSLCSVSAASLECNIDSGDVVLERLLQSSLDPREIDIATWNELFRQLEEWLERNDGASISPEIILALSAQRALPDGFRGKLDAILERHFMAVLKKGVVHDIQSTLAGMAPLLSPDRYALMLSRAILWGMSRKRYDWAAQRVIELSKFTASKAAAEMVREHAAAFLACVDQNAGLRYLKTLLNKAAIRSCFEEAPQRLHELDVGCLRRCLVDVKALSTNEVVGILAHVVPFIYKEDKELPVSDDASIVHDVILALLAANPDACIKSHVFRQLIGEYLDRLVENIAQSDPRKVLSLLKSITPIVKELAAPTRAIVANCMQQCLEVDADAEVLDGCADILSHVPLENESDAERSAQLLSLRISLLQRLVQKGLLDKAIPHVSAIHTGFGNNEPLFQEVARALSCRLMDLGRCEDANEVLSCLPVPSCEPEWLGLLDLYASLERFHECGDTILKLASKADVTEDFVPSLTKHVGAVVPLLTSKAGVDLSWTLILRLGIYDPRVWRSFFANTRACKTTALAQKAWKKLIHDVNRFTGTHAERAQMWTEVLDTLNCLSPQTLPVAVSELQWLDTLVGTLLPPDAARIEAHVVSLALDVYCKSAGEFKGSREAMLKSANQVIQRSGVGGDIEQKALRTMRWKYVKALAASGSKQSCLESCTELYQLLISYDDFVDLEVATEAVAMLMSKLPTKKTEMLHEALAEIASLVTPQNVGDLGVLTVAQYLARVQDANFSMRAAELCNVVMSGDSDAVAASVPEALSATLGCLLDRDTDDSLDAAAVCVGMPNAAQWLSIADYVRLSDRYLCARLSQSLKNQDRISIQARIDATIKHAKAHSEHIDITKLSYYNRSMEALLWLCQEQVPAQVLEKYGKPLFALLPPQYTRPIGGDDSLYVAGQNPRQMFRFMNMALNYPWTSRTCRTYFNSLIQRRLYAHASTALAESHEHLGEIRKLVLRCLDNCVSSTAGDRDQRNHIIRRVFDAWGPKLFNKKSPEFRKWNMFTPGIRLSIGKGEFNKWIKALNDAVEHGVTLGPAGVGEMIYLVKSCVPGFLQKSPKDFGALFSKLLKACAASPIDKYEGLFTLNYILVLINIAAEAMEFRGPNAGVARYRFIEGLHTEYINTLIGVATAACKNAGNLKDDVRYAHMAVALKLALGHLSNTLEKEWFDHNPAGWMHMMEALMPISAAVMHQNPEVEDTVYMTVPLNAMASHQALSEQCRDWSTHCFTSWLGKLSQMGDVFLTLRAYRILGWNQEEPYAQGLVEGELGQGLIARARETLSIDLENCYSNLNPKSKDGSADEVGRRAASGIAEMGLARLMLKEAMLSGVYTGDREVEGMLTLIRRWMEVARPVAEEVPELSANYTLMLTELLEGFDDCYKEILTHERRASLGNMWHQWVAAMISSRCDVGVMTAICQDLRLRTELTVRSRGWLVDPEDPYADDEGSSSRKHANTPLSKELDRVLPPPVVV